MKAKQSKANVDVCERWARSDTPSRRLCLSNDEDDNADDGSNKGVSLLTDLTGWFDVLVVSICVTRGFGKQSKSGYTTGLQASMLWVVLRSCSSFFRHVITAFWKCHECLSCLAGTVNPSFNRQRHRARSFSSCTSEHVCGIQFGFLFEVVASRSGCRLYACRPGLGFQSDLAKGAGFSLLWIFDLRKKTTRL